MSVIERRAKEKQARRQSILDSVRDLLDGKSFGAITMDEIAAGAEVSKGTVYYYFPTKNEILANLILQNIRTIVQSLENTLDAAGSPAEMMQIAFGELLRFFAERQGKAEHLALVLQSDFNIGDITRGIRKELKTSLDSLFAQIQRIVDAGIAEGVFFPEMDARKISLAGWGAAVGIHMLAARLSPQVVPETATDIYTELLKLVPFGLIGSRNHTK